MNKLNKTLFAALLSGVTILTMACGAKEEAKQKTEQAAPKLSSEEILKKFYENTINIKSTDITLDAKTELTEAGTVVSSEDTKMVGTFIFDKNEVKLEGTNTVNGKKDELKVYIKDNVMYMSNTELMDIWIKTSDKNLIDQINISKFSANTMIDVFKAITADTKVEEKDGKYEISYSGDGSAFIDMLAEYASGSLNEEVSIEKFKESFKAKKIFVKYIVDKNTLLPISFESNLEADLTANGSVAALKSVVSGTHSNVNNVTEIVLPDKAVNAIDFEKLSQLQGE